MEVYSECSNQVDYSNVLGEKILPFVFTLNQETSVLYPEDGVYQKFCYEIHGTGQDTSSYADLSHFLLGICNEITQEDIIGITVSIDDEPQEVVWGENVEIKTKEEPDNSTGCIGLKFSFPLDKVDGVMQICITLRTPWTIGPVNVCLFGGETTATGLAICGPFCVENEGCESVFYQKETVCVPVRVTPFAKPGTARTTCCGEPVVNMGGECAGRQTYCSFTVTQNLCVEIPISFGAVIETGTVTVQCGDVDETSCDCLEETQEVQEIPAFASRNDRMREHYPFNR